jgi:hypothetical protein
MNFKRKETPVDLDELDRALAHPGDRKPDPGPIAYAQPHIRNKPEHPSSRGWQPPAVGPDPHDAGPVIATFEELPTKEIDTILQAAREELASIEEHANAVKRMHSEHVAQIKADVERLRENIKLAANTFDALRNQIVALDQARNGKRAAEKVDKAADDLK